jgi:hypothetical protein
MGKESQGSIGTISYAEYLSENLLKADHSPPLDCGPARAARVFE